LTAYWSKLTLPFSLHQLGRESREQGSSMLSCLPARIGRFSTWDQRTADISTPSSPTAGTSVWPMWMWRPPRPAPPRTGMTLCRSSAMAGCHSPTASSTSYSALRCWSMSPGGRARSRGRAMLARLRAQLLGIRPSSPARSAASAGVTSCRRRTGTSPSTHTRGCLRRSRSCRGPRFCGS
jgi:hypothetical protein